LKKISGIAGRARTLRSKAEPQKTTKPSLENLELRKREKRPNNEQMFKGFLSSKERLALRQELSLEKHAKYSD